MIAVYLLGLIAAVALGAVIESHRHHCPTAGQLRLARWEARQWEAWGRHHYETAVVYRRAARKWATAAEKHRVVLRALGRVVAEGGTVIEEEDRHAG